MLEAVLCKHYGFTINTNYPLDSNCTICMETLQNGYVLQTPCGHDYHYKCLLETIMDHSYRKCPDCQKWYDVRLAQEIKLDFHDLVFGMQKN